MKNARDKTEKEPKMKNFDFGAFQNKMQMPSHDKNHATHNVIHMLFEAFHKHCFGLKEASA